MDACYRGKLYCFLEPLSRDLLCSLCSDVVYEAQRTTCGHVYCKRCLHQAVQRRGCRCAVCGAAITPPFFFNDIEVDRQVKNLAVQCPVCALDVSLSNVEEHLELRCRCKVIPCPNPGCHFTAVRSVVEEHGLTSCSYRQSTCAYCKEPLTYNERHAHYRQCSRYPLPCPYGCGQFTIPRKEMEQHLKICPEQVVECPFRQFGCQELVARRKLKFHEEEGKDNHLRLSLGHVAQLSQTVDTLQTSLSQLAPSHTQEQTYQHPVFAPSQSLLPPDSQEEWETQQAATSVSDIVCIPDTQLAKSHTPIQNKDRPITLPSWLRNASLFPSMPWVVKVDKFEDKCKEKIDIVSQPFFTDPAGYKFSLTVMPCGSVLPGYVSVYLALMKGPSDNILQWPCREIVRVSLLNQMQDDHHHSMTVDYRRIPRHLSNRVEAYHVSRGSGWGNDQFISHNDLPDNGERSCQYLKNDCLFFKIEQLRE